MSTGSNTSFVGYATELKTARALVRRHAVVLVEGLLGVGKTAFLERLAASLRSQASTRTVRLAVEAGATLGSLAARVAEAIPEAAQAHAAADAGAGAVERIAAVLERSGAALFLDGLDRLGATEAAALVEGLRSALDRAKLVAASSRRVPLGAGRDHGCARVVLRGLSVEDGARIFSAACERLGGRVPEADVATQAAIRCGGHPRALALAAAELSGAGAAPEEDPLAAAIEALAPEQRRLLRGLAEVGRPLSRSAVAAVFGPEERHLPALVERLLVEADAGARLAPHPAVAHHCRAGAPLGPEERREVHRAAAASVLREGGAGAPLDASLHLLEAGLPERARATVLDAAEALREAGLARRAIDLVERIGAALGEADAALQLLRAELLVDEHRLAEAEAALSALGHPEEALLGRARLLAGRIAGKRGRYAEAADALTKALAMFEERGDGPRSIDAQGALSLCLGALGRGDEARRHAESAVALSEAQGDQGRLGDALYALARARFDAGALSEAMRLCARSLEIHERDVRAARALVSLRLLAVIHGRRGDAVEGERLAERGIALARAADDRFAEAAMHITMGAARQKRHRPDLAVASFEAGAQLFARDGNAGGAAAARCDGGTAMAQLGDFDGARAAFDFAEREFKAAGDERGGLLLAVYRGIAEAMRDRHEEAIAHHDRALAHLSGSGPRLHQGYARGSRAASLAAVGRLAEASRDLVLAVEDFRAAGMQQAALATEVRLAAIEMRLGDARAALDRARGVLAQTADAVPRILALRVLDLGGDPGDGAARGRWADDLAALPRFAAEEALREMRWLGLALPEDFVVCAEGLRRPADLARVLTIRRDPSPYGLVVDRPARRVFRAGAGWIDLATCPLLVDLAAALASRPGETISHDVLFQRVWGSAGYDPGALRRVVQANVRRLRMALERSTPKAKLILADRARGYRVSGDARACVIDLPRTRDEAARG